MKRKLISLSMLVLLAGCQKEGVVNQQAICTYENEDVKAETIFEHDGKNVIMQTNHNQIELEKVEISKEELEATAMIASEISRPLSGVTYYYEIDDTYFNETLIIDFDKASLIELADIGLVRNMKEEVTSISIEATINSNREMGMTCSEGQ